MTQFQIGTDVVTHPARKTVKFLIAEQTSHGYRLRRVMTAAGGGYVVNPKYKGYFVPFSKADVLTKVGSGKGPAPKAAKVVSNTKTTTVAALKSNPFISMNIVSEFLRLQAAMSPENLTCDGERSAYAVRKAATEIRRCWTLLEQYIGQSVDMDVYA